MTVRRTASRRPTTPRRRGRGIRAAALALASLLLWVGAGRAQPATAAAGQRLAERYCARCHVVAPGGGAAWTDAPAFIDIAQNPKLTRAWMRDFVTRLHMHMLDTDRSPAEADAITAYLLSLRRKP